MYYALHDARILKAAALRGDRWQGVRLSEGWAEPRVDRNHPLPSSRCSASVQKDEDLFATRRQYCNLTSSLWRHHQDMYCVLSTSITYYYAGLSIDDLFMSFNYLLKSDQSLIEYGEWIDTTPNLPSAFRQLGGINLRERSQCINDTFPHPQYSKKAIDYFLSRAIFRKQMREFPQKVSASGWDIGQTKTYATIGFSGTTILVVFSRSVSNILTWTSRSIQSRWYWNIFLRMKTPWNFYRYKMARVYLTPSSC